MHNVLLWRAMNNSIVFNREKQNTLVTPVRHTHTLFFLCARIVSWNKIKIIFPEGIIEFTEINNQEPYWLKTIRYHKADSEDVKNNHQGPRVWCRLQKTNSLNCWIIHWLISEGCSCSIKCTHGYDLVSNTTLSCSLRVSTAYFITRDAAWISFQVDPLCFQ